MQSSPVCYVCIHRLCLSSSERQLLCNSSCHVSNVCFFKFELILNWMLLRLYFIYIYSVYLCNIYVYMQNIVYSWCCLLSFHTRQRDPGSKLKTCFNVFVGLQTKNRKVDINAVYFTVYQKRRYALKVHQAKIQ